MHLVNHASDRHIGYRKHTAHLVSGNGCNTLGMSDGVLLFPPMPGGSQSGIHADLKEGLASGQGRPIESSAAEFTHETFVPRSSTP